MSTDATETSSEMEDALLDLLYGELEGEALAQAEARVAADASASAELERMRSMRGAMRRWHEETEAEPSRGMDELLAAARAARPATAVPSRAAVATPDEDRGLWAKITAWFQPLLAHPGLAAAATLVVVAGVAGTFYMRGGSQLVEPTAQFEPLGTADRAAEAPTTGAVPAAAPAAAEPAPATPVMAPREEAKPAEVAEGRSAGEDLATRRERADKKPSKAAPSPAKKRATGKADNNDVMDPFADSDGEGGVAGGVVGGSLESVPAQDKAAPSPAPAPQRAEPPPPPPPAPAKAPTRAQPAPTGGAPAPKPSTNMPAPTTKDESSNESASPSSGEAAKLTREAQAAAARNDCALVRKLSARVRQLDAPYHARVFRRDPAVVRCLDPKRDLAD